MAEEVLNENQQETQPELQPENAPSMGSKIWAAVKEWFRKQVVALKIKPQRIPLFFMLVTTVYFMLALYALSEATYKTANEPETTATGICIFITTLLSLLYLVSFLNAFPKRKKPNIFFICLVFAMIAVMIACDIVYYVQMQNYIDAAPDKNATGYTVAVDGQPYAIVHIVLLGVSAVVFALLPVYSRLIKKINTAKKLESATENMKGGIDIGEE